MVRWNEAITRCACITLLGCLAFSVSAQPSDPCGFTGMAFPEDMEVLAAGAYAGRELNVQIDQSGHQATQMDVTVNVPGKTVALILGAYEPTIWSLKWTRGTRIAAILVGGYHRQVVAGVPNDLPVRIRSYDDGRGEKCGHFYISEDQLQGLNPLSRRAFGRPVSMMHPARQGVVTIGTPVPAGAALERSDDTPLSSFIDASAPLAGPAGIADAVRKGVLRPATAKDVIAWKAALRASTPDPDLPPVAGQGSARPARVSNPHNTYVVLKPFVFPAGLYGANSAAFYVSLGVPRPTGNPGHSVVYDFNTLKCSGAACGLAE